VGSAHHRGLSALGWVLANYEGYEFGREIRSKSAGAKEAAEKGLYFNDGHGKHPSGAEALVDLIAVTARLKSCPFKATVQIEFFRSL
jgi:hypothetical protein